MLFNNKKKKEEEKEKSEKINLLSKSVEHLNKILQEGNFVELAYLLGNKKEMFIRNFFAGISRGIGIRNRSNYYYGNTCNASSKNCNIKYSSDRRVYSRYCRDSAKK